MHAVIITISIYIDGIGSCAFVCVCVYIIFFIRHRFPWKHIYYILPTMFLSYAVDDTRTTFIEEPFSAHAHARVYTRA